MAIINNKHKFIFIHIPKTAGTSLSVYYSNISCAIDVEIGGSAMGQALEGFYTKRYGLDKHSTAKRMLSALGSDIFNNYYRFAFVRNPFTRTISTFKFLKNWLPQSSVCKDAAIFEKFETVDDMIASEYWQNTAGVAEIFCPQVRQLCT